MRAAADDHDVVGVLELRPLAPHAALAEDVKHGAASSGPADPDATSSSASAPDGRAAEVRARVGHRLPHVLRRAPQPNRIRKRSSPSRRTMPGVRATEPGRKPRDRRDLRAQVDRAEAGEHLAGERADERQRRELARRVDDADRADARRRLLEALAQPGSAAGSQTTSARPAVSGSHQASAARVARAELERRAVGRRGDDRREVSGLVACSSSLPRCDTSAQPTVSRHASRSRSGDA